MKYFAAHIDHHGAIIGYVGGTHQVPTGRTMFGCAVVREVPAVLYDTREAADIAAAHWAAAQDRGLFSDVGGGRLTHCTGTFEWPDADDAVISP